MEPATKTRVKLALKMNTLVGVPVILAEAAFSQVPTSAAGHFALAALGGYAVSLVFVGLSLLLFRVSTQPAGTRASGADQHL